MRAIPAFDHAILDALRTTDGVVIGPRWFHHAMKNLSALGSVAVAVLIVVLGAIYLLMVRRRRSALILIGCALGASIMINVLKAIVGRARPELAWLVEVDGLSFPSGHALLSSALYPTVGALIARHAPRRSVRFFAIGSAVMLALVVGWTRVFLGVHYPTDVLVGWLLGFSWAAACVFGERFLDRPARP